MASVMLAAPIPANDKERLAALRELLILDTPPEARFDKVVRFAAEGIRHADRAAVADR
jgi:transcription-repair coupling factor (superfamily II helicase)